MIDYPIQILEYRTANDIWCHKLSDDMSLKFKVYLRISKLFSVNLSHQMAVVLHGILSRLGFQV